MPQRIWSRVGHDDDRGRSINSSSDEPQDIETRVVGPVHVLDHNTVGPVEPANQHGGTTLA
jgi:hypothetical protein